MDLPPPIFSSDNRLAEYGERLDNLEGLLAQVGDDLYSTRFAHGDRLHFLEGELLQSARDLRDLGMVVRAQLHELDDRIETLHYGMRVIAIGLAVIFAGSVAQLIALVAK